MKKFIVRAAMLTFALYIGGVFGSGLAATFHRRHRDPVQPPVVEPPTVMDVDKTAMTVTIRTGKSSTDVYKLTKLTTILIDGKPGTIDGIQKGMKANVTGSASNLSKIELTTVQVGNTEQSQPKKNK